METLMLRNIRLLYAFKVIKNFLLIMPTIVLFFQNLGLTQTQIFILESGWAASILLCEVPCGYFADNVSRKTSMLFGAVLACLSYTLYNFSNGFYELFLANILMGVSYSFISGADSALAYDSFKVINKEEKYLNFEAQSSSLSGFCQVLASLIGGSLALIHLKAPLISQIIIYIFLIPISLFLTETPHLTKQNPTSIKNIIKITIETLFTKNDVRWLILYSMIVGNMTHSIIWLTQPLYQGIGINLKWYGLLWASQYLAYSIFSKYSERISIFFGKKKSLVVFLFLGIITYFFLAFNMNYCSLFAILFLYMIRGSHRPVINDLINKNVQSEVRATIFSIDSLFKKFFYMLLGPIIGLCVDNHSLGFGFLISGFFYLIFSILVTRKIITTQFSSDF
jgi:MFS family permease